MIAAAVVDASVAVKWVVREVGSDQARSLSQATLEAPDLLLVECSNILWKKARIGDLTEPDAVSYLRLLMGAPVSLTASRCLVEEAVELALEIRHPVYDCLYIALALKREIPLVTADARLVAATRKSSRLAGRILPLSELGR